MAAETIFEMVVVAQGVDWGVSSRRGPYANWNGFGKGVDPVGTSIKLGDMIVARFHTIAHENGSRAEWLPQRGHILAPRGESLSELDYVVWRERASGEVIDAWLHGRVKPVMLTAMRQPERPRIVPPPTRSNQTNTTFRMKTAPMS